MEDASRSIERTPVMVVDFSRLPQEWARIGDAMALVGGHAPGQQPVSGNMGMFLNSFVEGRGDEATGVLRSPVFTPDESSVLEVRLGGGRAQDHGSQVGLAILDGDRVVSAITGNCTETLVHRSLDLSLFAGRPMRLEVFDHSKGAWGHILVDELSVR
jgi:hypothetical protein